MADWNGIFKEQGYYFLKPHEFMPKIARLLKKEKAGRILDLGCGSGCNLVYLAGKGFDMHGTDISSEGLKLSKEWLRVKNLRAKLKKASFYRRFPFRKNFFDAVVSVAAIYHGRKKQIKFCIDEIERVLSPKGIIFLVLIHSINKKKNPFIKKTGKNTRIVTKGLERGVTHYIFTKHSIKSFLGNFRILSIKKDRENHYCVLGRLK